LYPQGSTIVGGIGSVFKLVVVNPFRGLERQGEKFLHIEGYALFRIVCGTEHELVVVVVACETYGGTLADVFTIVRVVNKAKIT
jgi:hypothetical protein